jgi:hypothetical protein
MDKFTTLLEKATIYNLHDPKKGALDFETQKRKEP